MNKKKRSEHHEEHADESWLLPYSDLLTLLLALFIVMYAMSAIDSQKFEQMRDAFSIAFSSNGGAGDSILDQNSLMPKGGSQPDTLSEAFESKEKTADKETQDPYTMQAQQEQQKLEELQENVQQYIKQNGLSDQLSTKLNHSELKITIKDSALFGSGVASLKPEAEKLALTIGDMIKNYQGYQIVISGHTDNMPIKNSKFESNWDLSSARALTFMKVVLEQSGLDPKNFQAVGMGEYHPVATNDTPEGRAQNRRVEVSILRKYAVNTPETTIAP